MLLKEIIVFILPILLAGLIHHFLVVKNNLFSFSAKPVDFNIRIGLQPLFGRTKTFRGLIMVPVLTAFFLPVVNYFSQLTLPQPDWLAGLYLGLGYALAELPNSFFKRRFKINSSSTTYRGVHKIFYLTDQIDSVIGALIALWLFYPVDSMLFWSILIIGAGLHFTVDRLLYKFSYKKLNKRMQIS